MFVLLPFFWGGSGGRLLHFNIRPDSRSSQDFLFFSPLCAKSASTSPRNPLYGSAISLEIKRGREDEAAQLRWQY